jgi:hypothetical protein
VGSSTGLKSVVQNKDFITEEIWENTRTLQLFTNYTNYEVCTKIIKMSKHGLAWLGVGNVKFKLIKFIRKDLFPEQIQVYN